MDREKIQEAIKNALQNKQDRKFKQTLEMIINFKGVDFKKNRLSIQIPLSKPKGKENKIIVVADEPTLYKLKDLKLYYALKPEEISKIPLKDIEKVAKKSIFLVQPQFVANVAKVWGKILGTKGNTIIPLVGDPIEAVNKAKNMVRYSTRGKFLPTIQIPVGDENSKIEDVLDNVEAILDEFDKKKIKQFIKSIYFKLTMSPPVKVKGE